jgi:secreted protein with Ig-like and vWFA domain
MSEPSNPRDELHDRLADQALRELLTGRRPPDLSAAILAAAEQPAAEPALADAASVGILVADAASIGPAAQADGPTVELAAVPNPRSRRTWRSRLAYGLAASLLIGIGFGAGALTVVGLESRRRVAESNELRRIAVAVNSLETSKDPALVEQRTEIGARLVALADGSQSMQGVHESPPITDSALYMTDDVTYMPPGPLYETRTKDNAYTISKPVYGPSSANESDLLIVETTGMHDRRTEPMSAAGIAQASPDAARRFTAELDRLYEGESARPGMTVVPSPDFVPNTGLPDSDAQSLTLAVTPRIIVQEEEEQLLGLGTKVYPVADLVLPIPNSALSALGRKSSVEAIERPLADILAQLGKNSGIEIQIDQQALNTAGIDAQTPTTWNLNDVKLQSILKLVLGDLELSYIVKNDAIVVTTPQEVKRRLSGVANALAATTDVVADEESLFDVLDDLKQRHHVEIQIDRAVMDDNFHPSVTVDAKNVPLAQALQTVLASQQLDFTIDGDTIMVTSAEKAQAWREQVAAARADEGRGPGESGDRYARIVENPFLSVLDNPLSTFSIDVDTASYAKTRRYLMQEAALPPPDAVRIEELVNYFDYQYAPPTGDTPFAAHVEVAACPWRPAHRLVRVGLKGREVAAEARPTSNLVFLLDVSGSMESADKLPRVQRAMRLLVDQLGENDRVAIVVYASAEGLVLPSTPGAQKETIQAALEQLQAGGSTNGGAGIRLAYDVAAQNYLPGGVNRVVLCTDGDFNVGTTSDGDLERLIEERAKAGVFLTVLGFGMGNHNDSMLEKLADKGNGNYGYIDTEEEAQKLLVEQLSGTLVTIAKDVKLQLEFNPAQVAAWRLIGYEDRVLAAEDFRDDRKDAGEIGAGHTVTALYEVVPAGQPAETGEIDPLKYQRVNALTDAAATGELLTLKVRYKQPDGQVSTQALDFPVKDTGAAFGQASGDFKFAAAVAACGMLLRGSAYKGDFTYDAVLEIAQEGAAHDPHGYRAGFLELVRRARALSR